MINYLNMDFFKKVKRKFIKMIRSKEVLALTLASALTLTGCVSDELVENTKVSIKNDNSFIETNEQNSEQKTMDDNNNDNTNDNNNDYEIQEDTFKPTPIVKTKLDEEMLQVLKTEVSLNDNSLRQLISKIGNISVNYKYSELFGTELALAKYEAIKEYKSSSSVYIVNRKINESLLKQKILDNNKEYLSTYSGGRYSEFSSSEFNKIFNIFLEGLEYVIANGTDLGQLDEKLGDLKIFKMSSNGSGVVTDENTILALNPTVIATYEARNNKIDYWRTVILHETMHFGQISSENEKKQEGYDRNLGISYRWDDLKVNPLNYSWYNEGTAEKLMIAQYGEDIEPTVYPNNIKSLDSITLSALLRNDVDELTLSKISLQTDLNQLFKIFNCKDEQDKIEVINMMYAFDITINQNTEFFNAYKEKYGSPIENRYDYFGSLNASIAQTLTKNFYINLSDYLINHNATLEDIFSNISIFETEMSRLTKFGQQTYLEENSDFIVMYRDVQNDFFNIVANYLGLEQEDIIVFYNAYYGDNLSDVSNTSMLTTDELNYINEILESRSMNKRNTVSEVSNSFKIQ